MKQPGMRRPAKAGILQFALAGAVGAVELPPGFTDVRIAGGLDPATMAFAPDGRLFVNEKAGRIRVVKGGALLPAPFATVPADPYNERGLLGLDFDPDFARNRHVYVLYVTRGAPRRSLVVRFTAAGDVAEPGSEKVIFTIDGVGDNGNHNGGTIAFGKDGKLYIALGNNAVGSTSQSLESLYGKVLRINPDGTIPADNPFVGTLQGPLRAIWALGFRNPWTFDIHPATGRLFANDVGGSGFEEITEVTAGTNHGFPRVEGFSGTPPEAPGTYKAPVHAYSREARNCAITAGAFFQPARSTFPPEFSGRYFFADYCGGWIRALDPSKGNAVTPFAAGLVGTVNLKAGPDGQLYYLVRGTSRGGSAANTATDLGELHRIQGPEKPTSLAAENLVRLVPVLDGSGAARAAGLRLHDATGRPVRRDAAAGLPAGIYFRKGSLR